MAPTLISLVLNIWYVPSKNHDTAYLSANIYAVSYIDPSENLFHLIGYEAPFILRSNPTEEGACVFIAS